MLPEIPEPLSRAHSEKAVPPTRFLSPFFLDRAGHPHTPRGPFPYLGTAKQHAYSHTLSYGATPNKGKNANTWKRAQKSRSHGVKCGVQLRILLGYNPRRGLNCGGKGVWAKGGDPKGGTEGGGINKDGGHGAGRRSGTRVFGKKGVEECGEEEGEGAKGNEIGSGW